MISPKILMQAFLKRRLKNNLFFLGLALCSACSTPSPLAITQSKPDDQVFQSPEEVLLRLEPKKFQPKLKLVFGAKSRVAHLELDSAIRDLVQVVELGNARPQEAILEILSTSTSLGEITLGYVVPQVWIEWPDRKVSLLKPISQALDQSLDRPKERKTPYWVTRFKLDLSRTGVHKLLISTTQKMQNILLEPSQARWKAVGNLTGEISLNLK